MCNGQEYPIFTRWIYLLYLRKSLKIIVKMKRQTGNIVRAIYTTVVKKPQLLTSLREHGELIPVKSWIMFLGTIRANSWDIIEDSIWIVLWSMDFQPLSSTLVFEKNEQRVMSSGWCKCTRLWCCMWVVGMEIVIVIEPGEIQVLCFVQPVRYFKGDNLKIQ